MNDKRAASEGEAVLRLGAVIFVLMNSGMPMTLALLRGWAPLDARARHSVTAWRASWCPTRSHSRGTRRRLLLLLVRGLHGLAVDLDHLLGDVLRHVLVAVQHGAEGPAPAGDRAQFRGVGEEFGLGHVRGDDLHAVLGVHTQDAATAAVQIAVHVAQVG